MIRLRVFITKDNFVVLLLFVTICKCSSIDDPKYICKDPTPIIEYINSSKNVQDDLSSSNDQTTPHPKKPICLYEGSVHSSTLSGPRSSCGNFICFNTGYYPKAKITHIVGKARRHITSEFTSFAYPSNSTAFKVLESKLNSSFDFTSRNESSPKTKVSYVNSHGCQVHKNTTYPTEGYSHRERKFYYIVNIPDLQQGVTGQHCESNYDNNDYQKCGQNSWCSQLYREQRLLVLPITKRKFKIEDLMLKQILVPHDCYCFRRHPVLH